MHSRYTYRWLFMLAYFTAFPCRAHAAALFEPTPIDTKSYTESWTAVTRLQNGVFIHSSMMISNAGLANGRGMCRIKIADQAGHKSVREIIVERDGWHFDGNDGLKIGACSLHTANNETLLDMPFQEGAVRLLMRQMPHPVPMPTQTIKSNGRFYDSEVLTPFADTQVTLDGTPGVGSTFFDHTRSNALPADLAYGWVRFRGFAPGCGRLLLARYVKPAQGAVPPQLEVELWREQEAGPVKLKSPHAALPAMDTPPNDLKLSFFDGDVRIAVARTNRRLLSEAPFEEHGILGRVVGIFVGAIHLETFDATLEDDPRGPCQAVPGILEVDHIDSHG